MAGFLDVGNAKVESSSPAFRTLIFGYADDFYFRFVVPYIYFALRSNTDVAVEVAVSDLNRFKAGQWQAMLDLADAFPSRTFLIRQAKLHPGVVPNTIRFLQTPVLHADYVYIGDIDIVILDTDLTDQHVRHMAETGLSYSNVVRPGHLRLTGLHFSLFSAYFPLPDLTDLPLSTANDEMVLYEIVKRKGQGFSTSHFRPIHGIHLSPNRPNIITEEGKPGWGVTAEYWKKLSSLMREISYLRTQQHFDPQFNAALSRIQSRFRTEEVEALEREGLGMFRKIYAGNYWGGTESRSGPGSSWHATAVLRGELKAAFATLGIRHLVDAPCGDANWVLDLAGVLDSYIGVDVVPDLILGNVLRYAYRNVTFKIGDISTEVLPQGDAILCRDCLVHFPFEMALRTLNAFACSGAKYLLSTTFPNVTENKETVAPGPWRPINLNIPPFDLPPPILLLKERGEDDRTEFRDKSIGVWPISCLTYGRATENGGRYLRTASGGGREFNSQRPVIGYRACRSGLNNQKLSLLGLLGRAIATDCDIGLPRLVNFATDTRGAVSEIAASAIFDVARFVRVANELGVNVLTEVVADTSNFHEMFEVGSLISRGRTAQDLELSERFWRGLRPNPELGGRINALIDDLFNAKGAQAVLQLRIEPDWQDYEATYMKVVDGEDRTTSYQTILAKIEATFGSSLTRLYVTCDEHQVPIEEITQYAKREHGLILFWKSDLSIAGVGPDELCYRTTIDFELAARARIFIGTSRSTFANLACMTGVSLSGGDVEHYLYNAPGTCVARRTDRGTAVDYRAAIS